MANYKHHQYAAVLLVFLFLLSSSPSSARLLNNIALPSQEEPAGHVSPCDHMSVVAGKLPSPGMKVAGGKYGALILNMLPKGTVPPSGPSKGTNNINN